MMKGEMVNTAQLRMIYGLAKQAGMDNDTLHDFAHTLHRVESLKDLSKSQASRFIDNLKLKANYKPVPQSADRLTSKQKGKIFALARDMGWTDNPKRLRGFVEARVGVSDINFLSAQEAGLVIEALKAIQAAGRSEREQKPAEA